MYSEMREEFRRSGVNDYFEFCSEALKTKEDFLSTWQECCDLMSIEAEIDDKLISKLESICPSVANELRADSL